MLYYLHLLSDFFTPWLKFLNVFKYQSFRAALACLVAFLLTLLLAPRTIRSLISLKIGQPIRSKEEVHTLSELHGSKAGTPTMGGLLIIASTLCATLLFARLDNPMIWALLFVLCSLGTLGFLDDYKKVTQKNSEGVSPRFKLLWQLSVALITAVFLAYYPTTGAYIRELYIPFLKEPLIADMSIFCIPFFILILIGCSNAVNLTDGLDGLAIGCTITVALAYAALCYVAGHEFIAKYLLIAHSPYAGEVSIFCGALVGAGMGFLWYNCHPAKIFMGDTGSLAIGGVLGTIAICSKQEILLTLIGGVFVMEALSVILQVGSFKLRKKRIFKMSPIHHHFELKGWHENQVIIRFWVLSILFALAGVATLKLR